MIAGILPWRQSFLSDRRKKITEEQRLLRDGWQYANVDKLLEWKNAKWRLLFKVLDDRPRKLPGFDPIDIVYSQDIFGNVFKYQYVEFKAVNVENNNVELYAYGNFIKGNDKPYLMKGRQLIKIDHENKSHKTFGSGDPCSDF